MNQDGSFLNGKRFFILAFGIGACGLSSAVHAGLVLDISVNGGAPIIVTDNGAGDANPSPNNITYNSTVPGFAISLVSANTNDPGNPLSGFIASTQTFFQNISGAPESVAVTLTDTGFTSPTIPPLTLESDLAATLVNPGPSDSASLTSTANATVAPMQTLTSSGSLDERVSFPGGTYFLSSLETVNLSPGASAAVTTTTSITPEPASIGLLGLGALGLLARRRRN